ncbi:MAG: MFS transporter, partial [Flavisolibacter sp.]
MKMSTRIQLSLMMFLNFFVWGAWFVTMGTYLKTQLNASDVNIGVAYGTQALGAIVAPFIIGLIADKFFAAQKILGVLHLVGAALMYYISTLSNFSAFYPVLLVYMILFMPTLALVNSVSFRQMNSPEKEFANVRVWGTIGWIVAGLIIGWLAWEQKATLVNTFRLSAVLSVVLGLFSFSLP